VRVALVLALGSLAAQGVVSCGSSGEPRTVIVGGDGGTTTQPKDATPSPKADGAARGTLRLVHLAEGLPAIDFCTRSGEADLFDGPVLGRDRPRDAGSARPDGSMADAGTALDAEPTDGAVTDASDAGSAGVVPTSASQYVSVDGSGTIELAIVPAGQGSCGQPLARGRITLDPGRLKTVIVHSAASEGGVSAGVVAYDDTTDVTPQRASLRLVYASSTGASLRATLYGSLTTQLGRLEPLGVLRAEADASVVDSLGYASVDPRPAPATLGIAEATATDAELPSATSGADLGLAGGSVHTGFLVRRGAESSLLYCNDFATDGPRTQCTVLPLR
jgi:hypothetical protein